MYILPPVFLRLLSLSSLGHVKVIMRVNEWTRAIFPWFYWVQGTAEREPFDKKDMDELIALATKGIEDLVSIQKKALKGIFK